MYGVDMGIFFAETDAYEPSGAVKNTRLYYKGWNQGEKWMFAALTFKPLAKFKVCLSFIHSVVHV